MMHANTPRSYAWSTHPGVVYLLKCTSKGEYKFGASVNPIVRLMALVGKERAKGSDLVFVSSIVTNCVGMLEGFWKRRWDQYRIDTRYEWVNLPESEVDYFRSIGFYEWPDQPPIPHELIAKLSGAYVSFRHRHPRLDSDLPLPESYQGRRPFLG